MDGASYEDRIRSQIEQYASTVNMHDLPDISHIWSHNYIGPGFKEVFKTGSINDCYANAFIEAISNESNVTGRILSIGCGDGLIEIDVAKILLQKGFDNFSITCAELSPLSLARLSVHAREAGVAQYLEPLEVDINNFNFSGRYSMMMANHSLHHVMGLENLFRAASDAMTDEAIFASCDVIGRNGHMRWPEAAAILKALWPILEPKQQYHAQLGRYSAEFIDHDCSHEGFEGIRAQDVLPLLLEQFHPYKWFGAGGFIDVLVDRGYGHGFDATNEKDVALIRFLCDLNDMLLDSGVITPTWMMGYFTKNNRGEHFYRNRRAATSVRIEKGFTDWVKFYDALPVR